MTARTVYLVGTIPLKDPAEVFRAAGEALGPALGWLPDGETGERTSWLPWLEPIFAGHGAFEQTNQTYRRTRSDGGRSTTQLRYRLKPGVSAQQLSFHDLPHARIAIESYRVFSKLKREGVLPHGCRLQVDFAGIVSV